MEIPESAITEVGSGPERFLTAKERDAWTMVQKRPAGFPPVGLHLQTKFFVLFIQGVSCEEIARLNPGIHLGQVISARMENKWDDKRQEHVEKLLQDTQMRLQQTTLEGIDFVSVQLAAVHKIEGDKIKRYLMTGDEKELGDLKIKNWSQYNSVLNILKALTGQDKPKPQQHTGEIVHKHEHSAIPAANRSMTTVEATSVIKTALENRKKG